MTKTSAGRLSASQPPPDDSVPVKLGSIVLGIDPGPDPGLVALRLSHQRVRSIEVLSWFQLLLAMPDAQLVSLERFVVAPVTVRRTRAGTNETLDMIGEVKALAYQHGVQLLGLPAGTVKPWATDERLKSWGIWVKGGHHRDAARHALYAAVRTGLLPRRAPDAGLRYGPQREDWRGAQNRFVVDSGNGRG